MNLQRLFSKLIFTILTLAVFILSIGSVFAYTNVDGKWVNSPTYFKTIPKGATAKCRDGTYSFSTHRKGTCAGHKGVARWL